LGSAAFVAAIERSPGPGKRGRKPRDEGAAGENIEGKTGVAPQFHPLRLGDLSGRLIQQQYATVVVDGPRFEAS